MTTTLQKGGKKPGSAPSSTGNSPAQQKTLTELMTKDVAKEQANKDMQLILAMITELKTDMKSNQQRMEDKIDAVHNRLDKMAQQMDQQIKNIGEQIADSNQKIQDNKKEIEEINKNMTKHNQELKNLREVKEKAEETTKKITEATLAIEMDMASHTLRLRNIPENEGQDLEETVVEALSNALDKELNEMRLEIDQIFRINSRYAKINKCPREVQINFVRRRTRDKVLRVTNEKPLQIEGKEIQILKQTPWKVREIRKNYYFLTDKLNKKGINFRWLIPEGMIINWQGRKTRVDTVEKAEDFVKKFFTTEESQNTKWGTQEETRRKDRRKETEEEQELDDQDQEIPKQDEDYGTMDIAMGAKRKTRAPNPTYKH